MESSIHVYKDKPTLLDLRERYGINILQLASEEVQQVQEEKRSPWMLKEKDEFTNDIKEYRLRKRKALLSVLEHMESGGKVHLSRRVIGIWAYQRSELKCVG